MEIELVATGDELLNGTIVDTNSPWLMERLAALGLPVRRKILVRDVREDIVSLFRDCGGRSDLVVCSGGLGPTSDDLTAGCAAEAAGVPLVLDAPTLVSIETRMQRRGLEVTENNRRQAMVPRGSVVHANRFGTAPMLELRIGGARVFLLPGVPREYLGLCEETLLPELAKLGAEQPARRVRVLRCYGIAESHLDARLADIERIFPGVAVGYRTTLPENHVRLVATGAAADAVLAAAATEVRARIGAACFSDDGESFSAAVGRLLTQHSATVAVAESLTGGLTGALLTEAPGASAYLKVSIVSYSDEAKRDILDVPEKLLAAHGAVSAPVASVMAEQARKLGAATFGISCTGLAGPDTAGSAEPVGTVFTAVATANGTRTERHNFGTDRERVRRFAAYAAIDGLRRDLLTG